jgi:hypothetical protein
MKRCWSGQCEAGGRVLADDGHLEAGIDAVATEYDPLLDNEPEFARIMAASVMQHSRICSSVKRLRCIRSPVDLLYKPSISTGRMIKGADHPTLYSLARG